MASSQFWALASAAFAAPTAIVAEAGVAAVNSDFATFVRTIVILSCPRRGWLGTAPIGAGAILVGYRR